MSVVARFAPSPTGNVHIGNIRTAIFNWLFARGAKGKFLLRVEDTDRERSTQEAIQTLLKCMDWLGLNYDGEIYYQSRQEEAHRAAAERLVSLGHAYRQPNESGTGSAIVFRIPESDSIPCVRTVGHTSLEIHSGSILQIGHRGASFSTTSPKGKPVECVCCLAGLKGLKAFRTDGSIAFDLGAERGRVMPELPAIVISDAVRIEFIRREVFYKDMVKGELSKPLDSMKDLVVVRADGAPVFHLANVCDDIAQGVTHIVRGDDHVENTYRHLLLFHALGATPPEYAHLPMIVNQSGKPYSKRDGDAFVGDFRTKGYLPEALFNYLALLGWSPGDEREKMTKTEMTEAFRIERAKSSPAQFDSVKLTNLNGMYIAELPQNRFREIALAEASKTHWGAQAEPALFDNVCALMQTRTKTLRDVDGWDYFFTDKFETDSKAFAKFVDSPEVGAAFTKLLQLLQTTVEFDCAALETAVRASEDSAGVKQGKLNQSLRVALTGKSVGAGIFETMELLGRERSIKRVAAALNKLARSP